MSLRCKLWCRASYRGCVPAENPPTSNPRVRVQDVTLLSDNWYRLHTTTFDYLGADGAWSTQSRESYDRGNGATILLFNLEQRTVLLTSQFRYPAYINGHADGVLIETAAGLLDRDRTRDGRRRPHRRRQDDHAAAVGGAARAVRSYEGAGRFISPSSWFASPTRM